MIKHSLNSRAFKFRLLCILLLFVACYSIIGIRLYIVQITQNDIFSRLAQEQYATEIEINQSRATIYDRHHSTPLAFNHDVLSAFVMPRHFEQPQETMSLLKKHFPRTYERIKKNPRSSFVWVKRNLSEHDKKIFEQYDSHDINYMPEIIRYYPFPEAYNVVGNTDIDNKGIEGVELAFDKQLKGQPSRMRVEKDARSKQLCFDQKIIDEGSKGTSLQLTIDKKLQTLAHLELQKTVDTFNAQSGSALILDPTTGHILAMAQYDRDKNKPLKNASTTDCYEFGSVIKTFAALAALEEGVTTTNELIDCEGKTAYVDRVRVENWKPMNVLPFSDVVRFSSNIGMAKIAKRLGPAMYEHFKKLGLGEKTGIEFPGERSGFVSHPAKWSRSSPIVMSFGYELNGTLLQLARAFGIIAHDGHDVHPTLVMNSENKSEKIQQLYKPETIETIKEMLELKGAHRRNLNGYRLMGKTGTARIAQKGGYSTTRHLYSFGGIVEKDDYKRVIITFVKEPQKAHLWASQVAAPLFDRIAEKMVLNDVLNPSTI